VLSFCDPMPRTSAEGHVVHNGHIGVMYAATSGLYTGRSTARTLRLLPDGSVFSERAIQKIRSGERARATRANGLFSSARRHPTEIGKSGYERGSPALRGRCAMAAIIVLFGRFMRRFESDCHQDFLTRKFWTHQTRS